MGCSIERDPPSPSAREQSLLRSLSAIRRPPKYHRSDSDGSDNRTGRSDCRDSVRKTDHRGDVVQSENAWSDDRQESLMSEWSLPANKAATSPLSRDENVPAPRFPDSAVGEAPPVTKHQCLGYRRDYALGDAVRAPSHMLIPPTSAQAIRATSALRINDFAFVKRSDGSFSYAILAYRCLEPFRSRSGNTIAMEECLVFAVSGDGSTKTVRKKKSASVRLVATEGAAARPPARQATESRAVPDEGPPTVTWKHLEENYAWLCQEIAPPVPCQAVSDDDRVPPSMISFVSQMDDDCSMISSVSERASRR